MTELTQLFKDLFKKAQVSNSNELLEAVKDAIQGVDQQQYGEIEQLRYDEVPAYRKLTPEQKRQYWDIVRHELINRIDALLQYKKLGLDFADVIEIERSRAYDPAEEVVNG